MLSLLVLLYLFQRATFALPLSKFSKDFTIPGTSSSTLSDSTCIEQRSIWGIIWSCLATASACSWISVHPNMPGIDENEWRIRFRRLGYIFWAIIAPEVVIFWAMKQWCGARTVAKAFCDRPNWTITHGHFLQMGGFMLCEGKQKIGILTFQGLKKLVGEGKIELPTIRKEEIEDRSKTSSFSKTIVTIQVVWFVLQCIARHVQGLVITELELATLALGILNGAMYVCWWGKPFDVRFQVPVYLLDTSKSATENATGGGYTSPLKQDIPNSPAPTRSLIRRIFLWPSSAILGIYKSMRHMLTMTDEFESSDTFGNQISTFYALPIDDLTDGIISAVVSIMGFIFGGIHCTAWFFAFPSFAELMIWRVCSVTIVGIAGLALLPAICQIIIEYTHFAYCLIHLHLLSMHILFLCPPVYVLARLALVIVAFVTLRDLQPEALEVVKWVNFLPHV